MKFLSLIYIIAWVCQICGLLCHFMQTREGRGRRKWQHLQKTRPLSTSFFTPARPFRRKHIFCIFLPSEPAKETLLNPLSFQKA